jgi:hypothetical protein
VSQNGEDGVFEGDCVADPEGETEMVIVGERGADDRGERKIVRDGECDSDGSAEAETVANKLAGIVCGGDCQGVDVGL